MLALATGTAAVLVPVGAAQAQWLGATQVGQGSTGETPSVAFDPAGNAAVAFGTDTGVDLVGRPTGGAFGPAQVLSAQQAGGNYVGGLALPSPGEAVLLVTYSSGPFGPVGPWEGLVRTASSAPFGPPQPLSSNSTAGEGAICCGSLLGAARGETIGDFIDSQDSSFLRVLAPGASRFGPPQRLPGTIDELVPDGAGGVFEVLCHPAACNNRSGVTVAYRPFGGKFSHGVRVRCGCGATGEVAAAGGRGHAALVWFRHQHLYAAVGGRHGFSPAHQVGHAGAGATGIDVLAAAQALVTPSGSVVVAWKDCSQSPCSLRIAFGNTRGRFTRSQTLGPVSTLGPSEPAMAEAGGHLIIAWQNPSGSVLAAACQTALRTCAQPSTLSTAAASTTTSQSVAFGPSGEALVAWSQQSSSTNDSEILADVYQGTPGP